MTTLPSWAEAEWTGGIAEPFRSDRDFWSGLAASADALITLAAAIAVSIVLALNGEAMWSAAPFVVPVGLAARAAVISAASSRRSREAFEDKRSWREAERNAVASSFGKVLARPRSTR